MEARRIAILQLHAHGKTPTEISRDLGCDRSTVYRVVAHGTPKAAKRSREKPRRSEEKIEAVRKAIKDKGCKVTIRGLAREFDTSGRTMDRLVKEDLGLKSFKRTPRQAPKPIDREKRLARAKILISKLKHKLSDVIILFSDETPFSLGEMVSSDTGFYLAEAKGARGDDVVHTSKEWHFSNLL
jgi:transposase